MEFCERKRQLLRHRRVEVELEKGVGAATTAPTDAAAEPAAAATQQQRGAYGAAAAQGSRQGAAQQQQQQQQQQQLSSMERLAGMSSADFQQPQPPQPLLGGQSSQLSSGPYLHLHQQRTLANSRLLHDPAAPKISRSSSVGVSKEGAVLGPPATVKSSVNPYAVAQKRPSSSSKVHKNGMK